MSGRWKQRTLACPLLATLLAACAESPSAPEAPAAPAVLGLTAARVRTLPAPACDVSQPPVIVGGLARYPSGQAQLSTNSSGQLVITNLGPSGQDGWCNVLPDWNGEQVTEPSPIQLQNREALLFHWRDQGGGLLQVGLRQQPGNLTSGFMDYVDDDVVARFDWYRNGQLLRSADAGSRHVFQVPDLAIEGWSFHAVTGQFQLRGMDRKGNAWLFTITPSSPLGRGPLTASAITLATPVPGRTLLDGLGQGVE